MVALTFAAVSISATAQQKAEYVQTASAGGTLMFENRARHKVSKEMVSWRSPDAQDLSMSRCPGAPSPLDYEDFVILSTYWVTE